ncbi:unnamed protein product [Ectocarpus fasciculatus]
MKKLLLVALVIGVGALLVQMVQQHYGVGDAATSLVLGADTEWAAQFSEATFDRVALGTSAEQVRELMGEPLRVWPASYPDNGSSGWSYSWQASESSNHHLRELIFDASGTVTEKHREFWVD